MKRKRVTSMFLTVSIALGLLAGCGSKTDSPPKTSEAGGQGTAASSQADGQPSGDRIKLRLLTISTDDNQTQIMEDYIKKNAEAELPDIEIEFEPGGGGEDMANKLKTYNASGDLPDVWYSTADFATAIIKAENQLDLTQHITDDGFIQHYNLPEALRHSDGKIYSITSGADTYFTPRIFYHKDIFEQNNIEIPKTFDELLDVSTKLQEKDIVPMSIMGKGGWAPQLYMVQTMIQAEDPQVAIDLLDNKTDFNNPVVLSALKRIETMAQQGMFPEGVSNLDYGPSIEMFTSKKTAMFGGFSWEVANLAADENIGMFMWPSASDQVAATEVTQFWGSPLNGYAVNANGEHIDAAVRLAEFCVRMEAQFYADQGSPINLKTEGEAGEQSELMKQNLSLYEGAEIKIPSIFLNAMDAKAGAEFGVAGASLLTGSYTAEQFVSDFSPVWDSNTWFS